MARELNIVMAQLNLPVGDINANTDAVIAVARDAITEHSADIVVFPELTLTGYPPEDLLLRPSLQLRIARAIDRILAANLDIYMVIGYPEKSGKQLFNSLTVIKGAKCLANYRKQHLPNYQVFDERRYFDQGLHPCVIKIAGVNVAFTICEDLWEQEPVIQARAADAQLMININASPYHVKKLEERKQLLQARCKEGNFPIVYVNLVGGQDELVFDGGSMAVSATGDCQFLAPSFQAGVHLVKVELAETPGKPCKIPLQLISAPLTPEAEIYQALVLGVRDYVNKNGFKGVVLGLSGGIDSALTLAIAVDALGAHRVQAVMMPFHYTSQLSLDAAARQAQVLGVAYKVIPIASIYESFMGALADSFTGTTEDVSEQNLQARCRGVLLMAISNKKGLLVLTTGNKSEIAVGYSTLYGDMAGGFDALKDVSKTMVYRLSHYRNAALAPDAARVIPLEVIERPPSAELAPDQIDQDSLPPYDELDKILEHYVEQDMSAAAIIELGFNAAVVKRVLRMVDLNEYKRRQSPVGVRLTKKGFGRDRRYPITNAWPLGE